VKSDTEISDLDIIFNGIIAFFRAGPVGPLAGDIQFEPVGRGISQSSKNTDGAHRQIRRHVTGDDPIHPGIFQYASFYHGFGAGNALFGRLEKKFYVALQFGLQAGAHDISGNTEHDGRVGIVAAGVHGPRVLGFIGDVVEFLDRQSVDISPQADGGSVLRSPEDTYRAGHIIEQLYFTIKLLEDLDDFGRGARFLMGYFRVHVEVPPRLGKPLIKL
jgi:hypothetical protein